MNNLKFERKQDLVLYTIARKRRIVDMEELENSLKGIMKRKEIYSALSGLKKNYLIKKYKSKRENGSWKILKVGLNPAPSSMKRIKNHLGKYWESKWEGDWKDE